MKMTKEQFEQQVMDGCNKVAQMIHEHDLSLTREQCWEMGKMLYLKSLEETTRLAVESER